MALRVEPLVPALRDLCEALAELGVDWAVAGAVAANNYRDETRTTTDLDVLLALAGSGMAEVEAALHRRGWTTTALVPEGWLLRVQHPRGGRIDVVASITDYEARALARAHSATVDDLRFKTMAVEDVVILKLIANRFRDIADVESILSAKPRFDWAYMAGWFEEFDLGERYRRIEDDALAQGLISNADTRAASAGDGHRPGLKPGDLPDH